MNVRGRVPLARLWGTLLIAWAGLSTGAFLAVEAGETRLLAPFLAGLVGVVGLWQPRPFVGVTAGLAGTLVFAAVRLATDGFAGLPGSLAAILVNLAGVGLVADLLARQVTRDELEHRHDERLIEELTPTSGESGALKWQHAARQISEELTRARRYKYPVALIVSGLDEADGSSGQATASEPSSAPRQRLDDVVRIIRAQLRPMDRVSFHREGNLAIVLPHTPLQGALTVVEKCRVLVKDQLGLDLRSGVAEFPADAGTPEELAQEAEAALEFARTASLRVASRSLLEQV